MNYNKRMNYLTALGKIHTHIHPQNYVEIGCRLGKSLALSKCPSVGIDPDFEIKVSLESPTRLYKSTSDDFFANHDIKQILGAPIDMAFIDGMHWAEYALRDFINIEKNAHTGTVVIVDDILPANILWATRERNTREWTGDVYKIIPVLKNHRPDLQITVLDVEMKGMAIITKLDPNSTVLTETYPAIENAILSSNYAMDTVEAVRAAADPQPIESFEKILNDIKAYRK